MYVSVCMSTFNGCSFIEKQIASVLGEMGPSDELVVSDDGSTDDTVVQIQSFGDPRIRFIDGPPLRSPSRNLERALASATGDIVVLCDQDDVWLPGRLETVVALHETSDVVLVDCRLIDTEGCVLVPSVFERWASRPGLFWNLYRNRYIGCCMSIRRSLLEVALPFPPSIPMHDSWIGILGELTGRVTFHPEPLVLYRQHAGNVSPAGRPSPNSRAVQAAQRLRLLGSALARVTARRLFRTSRIGR